MIVALFLFFTEFLHPTNSTFIKYQVVTGDKFLDSGGAGKPYINCSAALDNMENCTSKTLLCGDGAVSITFTEFGLFPSSGMAGGDNLSIFSGNTLLYSSTSSVSAIGKTFTSRDSTGCLLIVFTATSSYAMQGWSADITVLGGVEDTPVEKEEKECNLVCKANVVIPVSESISLSVLDFIMNPGPCLEEYTLIFSYPDGTNKYTPPRILDTSHKGHKFEYKVMITYKGISNYCWGYLTVR